MQTIARDFKVVIPVSYYERVGETTFNTVAVIDADGTIIGKYRKTHIPDDHFYQEKFYFTPGEHRLPRVPWMKFGVGENRPSGILPGISGSRSRRGALALLGCGAAALSRRPSARSRSWTATPCRTGGAACRATRRRIIMPVIAANRIGTEAVLACPEDNRRPVARRCAFYGSSFLADETGALVEQADRENAGVLTHTFDLDEIREMRGSWGVYRDRRPEMYGAMRGYGL